MSEIIEGNISTIIKERIDNFELNMDVNTTGKVISYADGVAEVYGIKNAIVDDLIEFDNGEVGAVSKINETSTTVVILGKDVNIIVDTSCTIVDKKLIVPLGESKMNKDKTFPTGHMSDIMSGRKRRTASDIKCKENKVAKRRAKNKMKKRS